MEQVYTITFSNDYPLIQQGDEFFFIDLGCPISFGNGNCKFILGDNTLTLENNPLAQMLTPVIGRDVRGLIGSDILSGHNVLIDYPNGQIVLDYEGPMGEAENSSWSNRSYAMFTLHVDGSPYNVILDTGAPHSYMIPGIIPQTDLDFYIDDDGFSGHVHSRANHRTVSLQGRNWDMVLGEMDNKQYIVQMKMLGADGVVGKGIFDQFKVVLDANGCLHFEKIETSN